MFHFLKRLLGHGNAAAPTAQKAFSSDLTIGTLPANKNIRATNSYFDNMQKLQGAVKRGAFEEASRFVRESFNYIPAFVGEWTSEYGKFDIASIPALQEGGIALALIGDDEGLSKMAEIVASIPQLAGWIEPVQGHQRARILFQKILTAITEHPNCLQTDMKHLIGEDDGSRIATLIYYLEKAKKIVRVKKGRTYRLLSPDSPDVPVQAPKPIVHSHRQDRKPPPLYEIDIGSIDYIPLPRAPLRWEQAQTEKEHAATPELTEPFEIRDADWKIPSVEKTPVAERPDTAFRRLYPTSSGLLMLDDLGKADGLGQIEAAALRYDRQGKLVAKKALRHGIYRVGVHPFGGGLIALSRDGVIHAYNDQLDLAFETTAAEAPEILAIKKRLQLDDENLKNYIRCVALSETGARYLVTIVDEAWCVDAAGKGLWGIKLPIKDGWTKVTNQSQGVGTSVEIDRALSLMSLSFPLTQEDLKRRYRELAKQWHPDLNADDPKAEEKMKALTAAAELLTGIDGAALPKYTGAAFVKELYRTQVKASGVTIDITMEMQVGEMHAADWVYAACFSSKSDSIYLAGYSGRVILVNGDGVALRAYDIGTVPRRIIDTGEYLYLLTDTRLYVLRDNALHALIDTFEGGDLIVAQTGFGLLESKRLRWFRSDGKYLGSVMSKEPIRRVYSAGTDTVVETRQRRAVIAGIPEWWSS